jgi:hypothetical protein
MKVKEILHNFFASHKRTEDADPTIELNQWL